MGNAKNTFGFYIIAISLVVNTACPQNKGCKKQARHGASFRTMFGYCHIYKNSSLYNDSIDCRSGVLQYWKKCKNACTLDASCNFNSSHVAASGSRGTPVWSVDKRRRWPDPKAKFWSAV